MSDKKYSKTRITVAPEQKLMVEAYIRFNNYERLCSAIGYITPNKPSRKMKIAAEINRPIYSL